MNTNRKEKDIEHKKEEEKEVEEEEGDGKQPLEAKEPASSDSDTCDYRSEGQRTGKAVSTWDDKGFGGWVFIDCRREKERRAWSIGSKMVKRLPKPLEESYFGSTSREAERLQGSRQRVRE
ncbi:hypothetical protein CISG_05680 [Coccidioides immitis RMSCC 3703]|uniref:Uncharacterized protein n=1 Tax=Coccidioides immitis RMSCC 3703 TaxID=454286 RepID=A0A0J8TST2_COCIT|nr:hypothetical protein CISG_05680 [Coccidioides immitis RMSCC 3703]